MARRLLSALFAALLALTLVGVASAHANLVSSTPADGANLDAAPEKITLVFSEELKADGNLITVTDAAGKQVDAGDTALDLSDANRVTLTVSLQSGLGDGAYTIAWKNASTDGHSEEGTLAFTVGSAAPATLPATGAEESLPAAALLLLAAALVVLGLGVRRQQVR
jgi:methionine-rich copper-binding protein CopC